MNIQRTENITPLHAQSEALKKIDSKALLPASPEMSVDGLDDALAVLTALSDKQRSRNERDSKVDIKHHCDKQKRAREEAIEQRKKAREAEETAGIFKIVAVIGSIAATAATLGAGAPVAVAVTAAALSASSMIVNETKCLGEASGLVGTALGLGSMALSGGASAFSGAAASGAIETGARVVSTSGQIAQVVGKGGAAIATRIADQHAIKALREQFAERREQESVNQAMESLEDLNKSHRRAEEIIQGIRATHQQTSLTIFQPKA